MVSRSLPTMPSLSTCPNVIALELWAMLIKWWNILNNLNVKKTFSSRWRTVTSCRWEKTRKCHLLFSPWKARGFLKTEPTFFCLSWCVIYFVKQCLDTQFETLPLIHIPGENETSKARGCAHHARSDQDAQLVEAASSPASPYSSQETRHCQSTFCPQQLAPCWNHRWWLALLTNWGQSSTWVCIA